MYPDREGATKRIQYRHCRPLVQQAYAGPLVRADLQARAAPAASRGKMAVPCALDGVCFASSVHAAWPYMHDYGTDRGTSARGDRCLSGTVGASVTIFVWYERYKVVCEM